jgi:hypothetical protein
MLDNKIVKLWISLFRRVNPESMIAEAAGYRQETHRRRKKLSLPYFITHQTCICNLIQFISLPYYYF